MKRTSISARFRPGILTILALAFSLLMFSASNAAANELVKHSLCDVRVLYLFDDPTSIEWPTLYYLNDEIGCRIELLTASERARAGSDNAEIPDKEIYLTRAHFPAGDSSAVSTLIADLFYDRPPDIVIFGDRGGDPLFELLKRKLIERARPEDRLFNILKVYRKSPDDNRQKVSSGAIALNSRELFNRYHDRMKLEIPVLFPLFEIDGFKAARLTRYALLESNMPNAPYEDNFMSGIGHLRLTSIIDSVFVDGPLKQTIMKQARKYVSSFNASKISVGQTKVSFIVDGYREMRQLSRHESAIGSIPGFQQYLLELERKAELAALKAVGITWEGRIVLRDSPHGPRLKFIASVSANGPKEIELNGFTFHPYWDSVAVPLDETPKVILPHQSYTREFFVDIERSYLDGEIPDSLEFTVDAAYGQIPLTFTSKIPVWQAPDLEIEFEPDYYFVKPFPSLEIDRLVTSLNMKAVITKPYDYAGIAQLNLQTPRGLFAGAYRKELELEKGTLTETVRIPFTISNLFELGIQYQTIELSVDDKLVDVDTSRIRIASCDIADTIKVAFMPDTLGMLEDILRMTEVAYLPLTDRALVTADLDAYNVIVIGSGSFRNYPSFHLMKNRFEEYLRQGGSLVVLGQPDDWPSTVLPVSFVPVIEVVDQQDVVNRIPGANLLGGPYPISEKNLLSSFFKKRDVSPAVISPAEKIYVTPTGATLLSVSRLGDGQIIFCGFPLPEMISRLDIDAIHLFANILNY
ncbi:MAG: hypothetical protein AB1483_14180 [Candidatus Zixiibacteriota bacterium]